MESCDWSAIAATTSAVGALATLAIAVIAVWQLSAMQSQARIERSVRYLELIRERGSRLEDALTEMQERHSDRYMIEPVPTRVNELFGLLEELLVLRERGIVDQNVVDAGLQSELGAFENHISKAQWIKSGFPRTARYIWEKGPGESDERRRERAQELLNR